MHNLRVLSCLLLRFFVFLPILCLISFSTADTAFADSAQASPSARADAAQRLSHDLVALNARYRNAASSAKGRLLEDMLAVAVERRDFLATLIEEAPGQVVKTALPEGLRAGLPAVVQAYLETDAQVEGALRVLHVDDQEQSRSRYLYFVETPFGERFSLHFAATPPALISGGEIRASGILLDAGEEDDVDGFLALESAESDVELLACCEGSEAGSSATPELTNTFGQQRTAVLLVNFLDDPSEPWTVQAANDLVFGTVSEFFLENSYQQTWLSGDVYGWYTIEMDSTTCAREELAQKAHAAAAASGFDPANYDRLVYAFPKNSCSWAGIADLGGPLPTRAWIRGDNFNIRIVGHEMGHNFGLFHSHGLNCSGGVLESSCTELNYGDNLDIMGNRAAHLNTFQKELLGWLNFGASPPISTVDTSGSYTITPAESLDAAPKALKILRQTDPITGQRIWYYLEYRQGIGFDSFLTEPQSFLDTGNVLNGVVFHRGIESDHDSSFLLDMTPDSNTTGSAFADLDDPALEEGQSYTDSSAAVTITTDWTEASGATVGVTFGPMTCVHANPSLTLSPSESLWVQPGTLVTYSVTATNHDDLACTAISLNLSASLPAGWTGTFASPSLTLMPGESGNTTLDVASPAAATDGFYDIVVTAENGVDPAFAGSATATYVVSAAVNQPPTAVNDSATTQAGTPVAVAVLANDWDPDGDPLTVTAATAGAKGTVTVNGDGTITYKPNPKAKGRDSFAYSVSDGLDVSDAVVTVSVKKAGGGKGKPDS